MCMHKLMYLNINYSFILVTKAVISLKQRNFKVLCLSFFWQTKLTMNFNGLTPTRTNNKRKFHLANVPTNNNEHQTNSVNNSFQSPLKRRKLSNQFLSPLTTRNNGCNNVSSTSIGIKSCNSVSKYSQYFIIPSNETGTHEFLLYDNNKFILNGQPYEWNEENRITSRYWRCCKYKEHCQATIVTHQHHDHHYEHSQKFGVIQHLTPHTKKHEDTWTSTLAEKKICMHIIRNSALTNKNALSNYKQFQRLYPKQSMDHFRRYTQLKSYLSRNKTQEATPGTKQQYIEMLQSTNLEIIFRNII